MFSNYKDCLFKNKIILKSQQSLKLKQVMYILKKSIRFHSLVMMIKKLQTFDKIIHKHIHMEQILLKYVKVRC